MLLGDEPEKEEIKNENEEIKKDCSYKLMVTFYIIVRGVYACVIFYFVPYIYLFVAYSFSLR